MPKTKVMRGNVLSATEVEIDTGPLVGGLPIEQNGFLIGSATILNFTGGVTVTNTGGGQITVNVTGSSSDGLLGSYQSASSTARNIIGLTTALGPVLVRDNAVSIGPTLLGVQTNAGDVIASFGVNVDGLGDGADGLLIGDPLGNGSSIVGLTDLFIFTPFAQAAGSGLQGHFIELIAGDGAPANGTTAGGTGGFVGLFPGVGGAGSATKAAGGGAGLFFGAGDAGVDNGGGGASGGGANFVAGASTGTHNGGTLGFDGGRALGSGVDGDITIGTAHITQIRIGQPGKQTRFFGNIQVDGLATFSGNIRNDGAGTNVYYESISGSTAAVSNVNEGRIRYNSTGQQWEQSVNGGAYTSISGGLTLAAVGASPNANGATLSGSPVQTLMLQPADGTHPGSLTAIAQTIGGAKIFSSSIAYQKEANYTFGVADSTTATAAGGTLAITGAIGGAGGVGGPVTITGGAGGTDTGSGPGGGSTVSVTAGAGANGSGANNASVGGQLQLRTADGGISGSGNAATANSVVLNPGTGGAANTAGNAGDGGDISLRMGKGGAGNGSRPGGLGGAIVSGFGVGGSGAGGDGGTTSAGGDGGGISFNTGVGGAGGSTSGVSGNGGAFTIQPAAGGLTAGSGSGASGNGGNLNLLGSRGGNSNGTSAAGSPGFVRLYGGAGGNGSGAIAPAAGATIDVQGGTGGTGGTGNANGGAVTIEGGAKSGTGTAGIVAIGTSVNTSAITVGSAGVLTTVSGTFSAVQLATFSGSIRNDGAGTNVYYESISGSTAAVSNVNEGRIRYNSTGQQWEQSVNGGAYTAFGGGVSALSAVGASPNANGATITGSTLNLQAADASNPGALTAIAQAIGGAKTFSGAIFANAGVDRSSAATLSLGTTNANAIAVGQSGVVTTVTGGLTQLTGAVSLTANATSSFTTSSGNLSFDAAGIMNIGATNATTINVSNASGFVEIFSDAALDGSVTLGTTTANTVVFNAVVNSNVEFTGNRTIEGLLSAHGFGEILTVKGGDQSGGEHAAGSLFLLGGVGASASSNGSVNIGTANTFAVIIGDNATGGAGVTLKGVLAVTDGSNRSMGVATLSGGTVTVSNTRVTANTRIFLSDEGGGVLANIGSLSVGTVTAGTSFVINSSNVLDSSKVAWLLIEPN